MFLSFLDAIKCKSCSDIAMITTDFLMLPVEIWKIIFSYLSQYDILQTLAPTNKAFYELSKQNGWFTKITINCYTEETKAIDFLKESQKKIKLILSYNNEEFIHYRVVKIFERSTSHFLIQG